MCAYMYSHTQKYVCSIVLRLHEGWDGQLGLACSIDNRDVTGIGNADFSHYTPRCAPEVETRSNLALINLNKDLPNSHSWRATIDRQMAVQAGKRSDSGKPVYWQYYHRYLVNVCTARFVYPESKFTAGALHCSHPQRWWL